MDCREVRGMLGRWHDQELGPEISARLEAHLAACPACAAMAADLRLVDRALQLEIEASGLRSQVLTRIHREDARDPVWWLKLAAAALIALALGMAGGHAVSTSRVARTDAAQPAETLALLEQSFAPGSLAGIDDLAADLPTTNTGNAR